MLFDHERFCSLFGAAPVDRSRSTISGRGSRGGFISVAALILLLVVGIVVCAAAQQWRLVLAAAMASGLLLVLVGNGILGRLLASSLQEPAFLKKPTELSGFSAIV